MGLNFQGKTLHHVGCRGKYFLKLFCWQGEKVLSGQGYSGSEICQIYFLKFCDILSCMNHKGGFVSFLLSHRFGGHIGAIGLNHQPVEGDKFGSFLRGGGVFEGNDAGEGNVVAVIEDDFGLLGGATKAVEDDFADGLSETAEYIHSFIEGFSRVDDNGEVEVACDVEMFDEKALLLSGLGEIVMEIEASLSDGDDFFVLCDFFEVGD